MGPRISAQMMDQKQSRDVDEDNQVKLDLETLTEVKEDSEALTGKKGSKLESTVATRQIPEFTQQIQKR